MTAQIETKMIEDVEGSLAVCIDKESKYNGWLFSSTLTVSGSQNA